MKYLPAAMARHRRRGVVVAMVLGTALTALGPLSVAAAPAGASAETVGRSASASDAQSSAPSRWSRVNVDSRSLRDAPR